MLAVGSTPVAAQPPGTAPEESRVVWKRIVEPVQPFLDAVSKRLEEQVGAFDPEISAYARYAL
ncbi:MAG: hypothetical protein EB141_01675, partial [Verrucomicrobia bacterium]|nr:hypothetical protein [Verrucomicrobiota bacterium]